MSALLAGPQAITPWIATAVAERLRGGTGSAWEISGPRLAQVLAILTPTQWVISDGVTSVTACMIHHAVDSTTTPAVGCLVRIPETWTVAVQRRSVVLEITDSIPTVLGGTGLATVGHPMDVHQNLSVRRLLQSFQWQWSTVITERLQKAQQGDGTTVHAPASSTKNTPGSPHKVPLGNTAALLGLTTTAQPTAMSEQEPWPSQASTTDAVQALFGRVLAAAEQQDEVQAAAAASQSQLLHKDEDTSLVPPPPPPTADSEEDDEPPKRWSLAHALVDNKPTQDEAVIEVDDDDEDAKVNATRNKDNDDVIEVYDDGEEEEKKVPNKDMTTASPPLVRRSKRIKGQQGTVNNEETKEAGGIRTPRWRHGQATPASTTEDDDDDEVVLLETQRPEEPREAAQDELETQPAPQGTASHDDNDNAPFFATQPDIMDKDNNDDDGDDEDDNLATQAPPLPPADDPLVEAARRVQSVGLLPEVAAAVADAVSDEDNEDEPEFFTQAMGEPTTARTTTSTTNVGLSVDPLDSQGDQATQQLLETQPPASQVMDSLVTAKTPTNSKPRPKAFSTTAIHRRGSTGGMPQAVNSRKRRYSSRRLSLDEERVSGRLESVSDLNLDVTLGALPPRKKPESWRNIQGSYIEAVLNHTAENMYPAVSPAAAVPSSSESGWAGDALLAILQGKVGR